MGELPISDQGGIDLVAVAVGNSRARIGRFAKGELDDPVSLDAGDAEDIVERVRAAVGDTAARMVVIASVNPSASGAISAGLAEAGVSPVYSIGDDLPIPINHALHDEKSVGHDRLLCALAAFNRAQQACIVVDAGTAITVDFVDGEGVFHGGAIAPGVGMMLRSMHEQIPVLPLVETIEDVVEAQGKDTRSAMMLGVLEFARGGVHRLIERYAQAYGAYPQIVATGGDAALLFRDDDVIEHVVADLQLMGIHEACRRTVSGDDD